MVYCSAGPTKLRRQSIATSAQPRFAGLPDQLSRELAALLVPVHDRHDLGLHKAVDHVAYGSMSFDIAGSMTAPRMAASKLRSYRARHELDRRGPGRRCHHRVDVASAVAQVLGPVRRVDLIIDIVVGVGHEGNVLANPAGLDVACTATLSRAEPGAGGALP